MKRIVLTVCLLLCIATCLLAEEFIIRQADELTLEQFSFQTADGGWLVFFSDNSTLSKNIYCHKLSAAGELLTDQAILLAHKEIDQKLLDVIPTSDGNFIIIWKEIISTKSHDYMQKVTPEGQCLWLDEGVLLSDQFTYSKGKILANDNGGIIAVFQNRWANPIFGQNFDSGGNKLWGETEIALVEMDDMVEMKNVLSCPGGGFLVHICIRTPESYQYKVLKFSDAGVLIDDDAIPALNLFDGRYADIIGPVNGEYLLYTVSEDSLKISKTGTNGEALFTQNLECDLLFQRFSGIWLLRDGRMAYVLAGGYNLTLTLHMLSADLQPLWNAVEQYPSDGKILMAESPDGKILLAVEPYVQIFDAAGGKLFTQSLAVTDELYTHPKYMVVLPANDRGIFLWHDILNRRQMIKIQVLNIDGTLAHGSSGIALEDRLAGVCDGARWRHQCFSLGNRFLSIWMERRHETSLTDGYQYGMSGIYYQLFDANMQPLLELNGRSLQPLGDDVLDVLQFMVDNDSRLYILYTTLSGGRTFLQAIDYHGNLCFGESGIMLGNQNHIIGCVDQAVYLFWLAAASGFSNKIMGQKYINCQAQWNPQGELLLPHKVNHNYTLLGFKNGLLIFSDHYSAYMEESFTHLKALLLDAHGVITATGGSNDFPLSSMDVSQENTLIGTGGMGDDCCLIFRSNNPETSSSYIMQKISPQGDRMWGEDGISFDVGGSISNPLVKDDALIFLAQNDAGYNLHRVDTQGSFQTPEAGINIIPAAYEPMQPILKSFDDGSMICSFVYYQGFESDIYYRRLDANGNPADAAPVVLCDARNAQLHPRITTTSNTAFISWIDQRAGRDISGIWGNTVRSSTPNDDALQTPVQQAQIIGNYPNPFNPSTTISYHLAAEGVAKLDIYNIKGQMVDTLVNEPKARGKHQVVWDGKDFEGREVASGIYFVRLSSAGKSSSTHKMVLMK